MVSHFFMDLREDLILEMDSSGDLTVKTTIFSCYQLTYSSQSASHVAALDSIAPSYPAAEPFQMNLGVPLEGLIFLNIRGSLVLCNRIRLHNQV